MVIRYAGMVRYNFGSSVNLKLINSMDATKAGGKNYTI